MPRQKVIKPGKHWLNTTQNLTGHTHPEKYQ